jgi:hypothetical protein
MKRFLYYSFPMDALYCRVEREIKGRKLLFLHFFISPKGGPTRFFRIFVIILHNYGRLNG